MAEAVSVVTTSSSTVSIYTATTVTSILDLPGRTHCRGPLDGSLYAKVNKSRKSANGDVVLKEDLTDQVNAAEGSVTSEPIVTSNCTNPNVQVVNGNQILYKPQPIRASPAIKAPLADLSEFSSVLSITSCEESLPSFSTVTKLSVTSSDSVHRPTSEFPPPRYQEIMAEGSITEAAEAIVNDVIRSSTKSKDKKNDNTRFSGTSSCSATTLSSTTSGDDGPRLELSDNDTSDSCSIHEVHIESIEGALSPITIQGNPSPDIFVEKAVNEDLKPKVKFASTAPTIPAPPVPRALGPSAKHDFTGHYKSSEYAVPMRDMKITTVSSKRAVLVSASGENEDMASPSSDRRDSVYDEGNAYHASGYSTIEEYEEQHSLPHKSPEPEEHSYIPEDVQELLNGLTECTPISDIDSGFHGSSMALQSTSQQGNNVTSQSSSEMGESVGSPGPALSNKDLSPTNEQNYAVTPERNSPDAMNPQVMAKVSFFDAQAKTEGKGHRVSFEPRKVEPEVQTNRATNVFNEPTIVPKKNTNPGVPIPTQTLPEPQPAQVQFITMRHVYTNGQSAGPLQQGRKQMDENTKISNTLKTQPSATEYQQHPSKTVEKPPLPQSNAVTMRHQNEFGAPNDESDVEDEIDIENIRSMEEQIKHTQRHLEFLKEQQEKLVKRKQDRTKYRETLKRNSTNYDRYSQGYATAPIMVNNTQNDIEPTSTIRRQSSSSSAEKSPEMPPVSNVAQRFGKPIAAQHVTSRNSWNGGHSLNHTAAAASYAKNGPIQAPVPPKEEKPVLRRHQEKDDIIMSSDLQEQLAELDKCIAELTTSMDIPDPQEPIESVTMRPKRSYTLDIEHKMDPSVKQDSSPQSSAVPSPPQRSKSSFESYKRLSQDFDLTSQRRSFTEQSSPDDVFSPGTPNAPRPKKIQSPFPPQTSVTRRQHTAPQPPPKRRLSLEERLSPVLVQALISNPGAKPKEDIHSYKEDLAPEKLPSTPTFPTTPATPYVNAEPSARTKSPAGLVKTPLSVLHLQPTDKPKDGLSPTEPTGPKQQSPPQANTPEEDIVDGLINEFQSSEPEPQIQAAVALRNGLAKETDLLHDEDVPPEPKQQENSPVDVPTRNEIIATPVIQRAEVTADPPQLQTVHQPESLTSLSLSEQNQPNGNLSKIQLQLHQQQESPTPHRQYLLHNSSGSHSSHSPAATSSNSRRGSSDSLDGPSTRHSNSSILSSSSSSSATHNAMHGLHPAQLMRPGSQMSNYERHLIPGSASGTRSGDESFGSPQSGRTSSSSMSDVEKMNYDVSHATVSTAPKFIRDTTAYWYKPSISREEALAILRPKAAGSFIVRDSRCFPGAFGLALKVDKLPTNLQLKPGADIANEYVRHFLIEPSSRGVKLKGCPNEPVFGSLSALVYQHSITPLALPCKLIIPIADQEVPKPPSPQSRQPEPVISPQATANELLKQGAACNVIYIGCVDTESLTGPLAIERAIRETYDVARANPNLTSIVHFKVTPQGITLTDNARKLFFRKHYPTDTVTFCGLDPMGGANKSNKYRRWDATGVKGSPDAWLFGFVARKQAGASGNSCLVFAELDSAQPARAIVNFVMKVLIGFSRQNSSS